MKDMKSGRRTILDKFTIQSKSMKYSKLLSTILLLSPFGLQSHATESTETCFLSYENKTYINGNCKVTWDQESKTIFFDDEREVILCPDGKLFELGSCAGYQTRYHRHGVHGGIWLGGTKPVLSWNMGKTRNNDFSFIVKKQDGCWATDQVFTRESVFKGVIRFCY